MKASELYDLPPSLAAFKAHFNANMDVWDWVSQINKALQEFDFETQSKREDIPHELKIEGDVYIHPNAELPPFGHIQGPAFIGAHTQLRSGVCIRGNVIVGEACVVGNSCELKNCLLMDSVQVPHFNYVGDSILGNGAHLAAGAITANVRLDRMPVKVTTADETIQTSLKKLGALIGDHAEVGCNAVLQPGCVLGKNTVVGPLVAYRGYLAHGERALTSS